MLQCTSDEGTSQKFHTKLSEIGNLQTAILTLSTPAAGVEARKLTAIQLNAFNQNHTKSFNIKHKTSIPLSLTGREWILLKGIRRLQQKKKQNSFQHFALKGSDVNRKHRNLKETLRKNLK